MTPVFDPTIFVWAKTKGSASDLRRFRLHPAMQKYGLVQFWKDCYYGTVWCFVDSDCEIWLGNEQAASFCNQLEFVFKGIDKTTLLGMESCRGWDNQYHCVRLLALQLS